MSQRKFASKGAEIDLDEGDYPSLNARVWTRETPWIHISGFKLPKIQHLRPVASPRYGFKLPASRDFYGDDLSSLREILSRLNPGEVAQTQVLSRIETDPIRRWITEKAA
jgi:hypothetical protein